MPNPDFKLEFNDLKNYIPRSLRNPVATSLIDNLFNRFLTHDESVPLYGYVGRKPTSEDDRTPRVPEASPERDINTIVPILNFKVGSERVAFTVEDLINKANAIGISPGGLYWLYSQGNNYLPPINLDKFTNFFNYYWTAKAVTAVPDMPWNPELLPEYYTIAPPVPSDLNKLNVVAASTTNVIRTGTGFPKLTFTVTFTSPTAFTVSTSDPATYPNQSFTLTSNDQPVSYTSGGKTLLTFNVLREEIFDQYGNSTGVATFEAGDKFVIDITFLTRNYSVSFTGNPGVKGKITKVASPLGYQKIDNVQLREGDRVLIKNAPPTETGIYVVSPGVWERAPDFDGANKVAGARVFVKGGTTNKNKVFKSFAGSGGFGWTAEAGVTTSNTNQWQEGNYWVKGEDLPSLGLARSEVIQAVRPIIEYDGALQLNGFVANGVPTEGSGTAYAQVKKEFNQLPLFDLFRYDGTHAGLVSSVFYYEEDLTAAVDLPLQKRVRKSANDSADFIFNHGMADENGGLLFVKKNGQLKSIWHAGFTEPTVAATSFSGVGNGTLTNVTAAAFTQQQVWTLTALSSTEFQVSGSKMKHVPLAATVGTQYDNGEISFKLNAGTVPFEPGDVFLIAVGNLERPRYVLRDENGDIFDAFLGPQLDTAELGAWQVPRTFYNNPYNDTRSSVTEGVLYSHFRGILSNQLPGTPFNYKLGGSIKLWSEQQTLLASLLMQRDMTPISMIDLAQRQYENALNAVQDIFQQRIIQFVGDNGPILDDADLELLLDYIQSVRASDNDVRTVLYDSTSPLRGFPATLPQLGIAPLVKPAIEFDPVLGRTLLTHHDGHKSPLVSDSLEFRRSILGTLTSLQIKRSDGTYSPAVGSLSNTPPANPFKGEFWVKPDGTMLTYDVDSDLNSAPENPTEGMLWFNHTTSRLYYWDGDQWVNDPSIHSAWVEVDLASTLNSLMLLVEQKLYQGINPNARRYNFDATVLNDPAFQAQLQKELFAFAALNAYDPLAPDYTAGDPFTWNYSQANPANLPSLNTATVPARWHNLLKAHQSSIAGVLPTERPNLEPWRLLGFDDAGVWWATLTSAKQAAYTPYLTPAALDETYTNAGAVRVVKTASGVTTLSGLQTIDGVTLTNGDLVLIQNDTAPANNGIWVARPTGWLRSSTPLVAKTYVTASAGAQNKGTVWVLSATPVANGPVLFKQVREWATQLWTDIKAARPGLRLSVNSSTDELLPPYVAPSHGWASQALTTAIPPGASLGYSFGQDSPVETVWKRSIEYQYALARALFRYDPLAFLGFCWGFNWVLVDGVLYDGFDLSMPGHARFRLHGELIEPVERSALQVTGGTDELVLTYTAYDTDRKQNFTVTLDGAVIGYAQEGVSKTINGRTFTIEDGGVPFRIGDRFEVAEDGTTTFVPATTYKYMGFGQTFTHALRETSIDTKFSYAVSAFREWDVNMGYRAGGLVATDDLLVYTDNETLSESAFNLLFKRNPIARNEWAQALRVSVTQFGSNLVKKESGYAPETYGSDWIFRVEGYNPRYLDVTYYTLGGANVSFYALSKAHTHLPWQQPTEITGVQTSHLPLTITGIQNVIDFLYGYSRYLESRGWEFNERSEFNIDAETGRVRNYQLEIEKFVDRCYAGLELGQGHVLNPIIDRAWFNQERGLLSEFIDTSLFDITSHPGVFDTLGIKYKKDDLDVVRTNVQSSFAAAGPMYSAHVQLDEFEHVFIFNNYAEPSTETGLLYDPFSGGRVATYKFNGRKQATNTMRPEFGGHFLVGDKVLQNMQAATDNVAHFYDANRAFENETTSRHALALLGFSTKDYFDNLDISNKTQFNFWRGLIQAKGTNLSIDAYLNNNRFEDAKIDEYWAYKLAEYGDARQREFPELKLTVDDTLTQFTRLQFDPVNEAAQLPGFDYVYSFDEDRWFSIEDKDQPDTRFAAESAGLFYKTGATIGATYKLPFVADKLVPHSSFTQVNATTVQANATTLTVEGYGPARPRFNPIKLFNYVDQELVAEIPLWHPAAGIHNPNALESINIISSQNPARYNYSTQAINNNTYDPLRPWGSKEVGRVWFNTRNLAYLPYYDETVFTNRDERLSRWGALADYATIDVYEWVQSTVPPNEYNALALEQAGDADLDPQTKAVGEVADQKTYSRARNWFMRPIAWSFSPVPTDVDWEATPPFPGGSTDAQLTFSNGLASLDRGTFGGYGITAGMRLGAWNNSASAPKPLSEYLIENKFTKLIKNQAGGDFVAQTSGSFKVTVEASGYSDVSGQLLFTSLPTIATARTTDEDGNILDWLVEVPMEVMQVSSGETEYVVVNEGIGTVASGALHGATLAIVNGKVFRIELPVFGLTVVATAITSSSTVPTYVAVDALRTAIVSALQNKVVVRDAVVVTPVVPGAYVDLSNDLLDNDPRMGWRAWTVPTQAQLDADAQQPNSSWRPYLGDFQPIGGTLAQVQDAVAYAKEPLTLNDGTVIERYQTTWTNWVALENEVKEVVALSTTPVTFTFDENIDSSRASVYVNGIAQLKAAFTINGKQLVVSGVERGDTVTVIIRKYQPTESELAFDPDMTDNLAFQQQFKEDYEYVVAPVRDRDGSFISTLYYFWVKNKTTAATGKRSSVQGIAQELHDGPPLYMTFQNLSLADGGYYDSITISGLNNVVTKDDTFKLRFTRNFTLRDDPEELNLKNVHTEWALIREGQKTKIPESLWQKLTDSVTGQDAAGNAVPAMRRVLYDERNGTRTQFGFGPEQTLAPAELLRSSISFTILNTKLEETSTGTTLPDFIPFLDRDESALWFADAVAARKTMTDIWNQASVAQVNEIFFAALNDVLASNYELSDIFKTSRLSAYSIKVVTAAPVAPTYE